MSFREGLTTCMEAGTLQVSKLTATRGSESSFAELSLVSQDISFLRVVSILILVLCTFPPRKKVPAVPESLLKRRKAFAAMKAMRVKKMLAEKKVSSTFYTVYSLCLCSVLSRVDSVGRAYYCVSSYMCFVHSHVMYFVCTGP